MLHRPTVAALVAAALAAGMGLAAAGAPSKAAPAAGSLPSVGSGVRPGPDLLYAPPPRAPQLENTGPWKAEPILVSGAQAYRDGEWLYQDFLYDDHGATGVPDPATPYGPGDHLYSPTAGTYTYPKDLVYAHNAADLVELRVKPLKRSTAFRVTLNTLQDATRTAFTIALGESAEPVAWPHGAGVSSPAEVFLTWHGSSAEVADATGAVLGAAAVQVDLLRRQVQVTVPTTVWNPGKRKVRTTIGVGLWDADAGTYLAPQPGGATETTPGGGSPEGVALVNVAPRFDEPQPVMVGATMADTAAGAAVLAPWWRERQQSLQLARGDVSVFSSDVDFRKLAVGLRDESGVPKTGSLNRILASRFVYGQGLDPSKLCYDLGRYDAGAACIGRFVGQLQPYAIYVPVKPKPRTGYGLTLLLHSLSANYNQYASTKNQSQLGERDGGSIVVTPAGRGPDGFYAGVAEADTFEVWNDVARRYHLDPDWASVTGYSMGGFGTYRLLSRWPDLFARGFSVVAAPGSADDQLVSLRNTPVLNWNAAGDELVNVKTSEDMQAALAEAGVRYEHLLFPTADHLTLAGNDEYTPGAEFLGSNRVDRDPAHVTYVVDPREDAAKAGVVADHAYWLSNVRLRDGKAAPTGTIDVRSAGFGVGDAEVLPVATGGGAVVGGGIPAMTYYSRTRAWADAPKAAKADRIFVQATNVRSVTIDVRRARVSCGATLEVKSDGPLDVVLAGCGTTRSFR